MVNVTMPHCSTPWSCSVSPGIARELLAQRRRERRRPVPRWRRCRAPARSRRPRRARAGWRRCAPSSRTGGRRRGSRSRRRRAHRAACTSRNGGSRPASRGSPHVEEPGAARRPEVLATGGREEVAAERVDVDRELPDGLAGVEQVGHAGLHAPPRRPRRPGSRARPASGSTRSRPGAPGRRACRAARRPTVGPTRRRGRPRRPRPVRRAACSMPITLLAYSARDVRIRSPARERRRQRVERHVPRAGRVLDQRDLVDRGAEQRRHRVVDRRRPGRDRVGGGVPADARLELQVLDDGVDDDARRKRRARVVEVHDVAASGRVGPDRARRRSSGVAQAADVRCAARQSSQSSV